MFSSPYSTARGARCVVGFPPPETAIRRALAKPLLTLGPRHGFEDRCASRAPSAPPGGRSAGAWARALCGRRPADRPVTGLFRALAARLRGHPLDRHRGRQDGAGRAGGADRRRHGGDRQRLAAPAAQRPQRRQAHRSDAAGARRHDRPPSRRAGGGGGGRDADRRAGLGRAGRGRIRRAHAGGRRARGGARRRAAGLAGGAGQHRGRLAGTGGGPRRQCQGGRARDRVGRARGAGLARASAHHGALDGAARRHRELRSGRRQLPAALLLAERARAARRAGADPGRPQGAAARHHRGRRRRVRAQDRPLSGIPRDPGGGAQARPAGALDVEPRRGLPQRQSRARRVQRGRAGARRQGENSSRCACATSATWAPISARSAPTSRPST